MCGIAGRINFRSGAPVDADVIRQMCDLLSHRGPDDEGVYTDGPVGLGHRRLSIIDLSPAGHQPMSSADGRLWITFNGEVYNFLELRAELETRGHRFRTHTDTEVILAAYLEFGRECLGRFRGMFAFAIWDSLNQTLFMARDRLGKKPLVYLVDRDGIAFASEAKAFLGDRTFSPQPDLQAISAYLTYQYVPSPLSAFKGVHKLQPGHYLWLEDGRVTTHQYWKLQYGMKRILSEEHAGEELLAKLEDAVKLRLISDVPLGAFLSGGIDSATVVGLMAGLGSAPVKTFSIGFEEQDYDELRYARLIAERFGTDHHEFIVRPDAAAILPELAWHYNEPFADGSAIATYYLAKMTRQYVTVALSGDGGDESFAGYERYVPNVIPTSYGRLPRVVRWPLDKTMGAIGSYVRAPVFDNAKRFWEEQSETRERRYVRWMSHFDSSQKADLCRHEFLEAAGADATDILLEGFRSSDGPDYVDRTLDVDVRYYLPDDLLVKVDIASMAHGLEARAPFVDHVVMEFAASLPSTFKLKGTVKKYILKRAVGTLLPDSIVNRRKMGFAVPLGPWFRGELRDMAYDVLLDRRAAARGYFSVPAVTRLLEDHVHGRRSNQNQLFNLLMLELWHRAFIDTPSDAYRSSRPSPRAVSECRPA